MTTRTKRTRRPPAGRTGRKWSARVMRTSNALDVSSGIFRSKDPERIARSLKRSAEQSTRKKGTPFQSAMSMLNFYINRGGSNLPAGTRKTLQTAKGKLRQLFNRSPVKSKKKTSG